MGTRPSCGKKRPFNVSRSERKKNTLFNATPVKSTERLATTLPDTMGKEQNHSGRHPPRKDSSFYITMFRAKLRESAVRYWKIGIRDYTGGAGSIRGHPVQFIQIIAVERIERAVSALKEGTRNSKEGGIIS